MIRLPNLPPQQWRTQQLVHLFNEDEARWQKGFRNSRRLAMKQSSVIPELIEKKILLIRGLKVMLDFHLAELYEVETNALKRAVRRNMDRFPDDFIFQLTNEEHTALRYQFGTLKRGEHLKYLPFAFTEQGVAMLSSVLHSKRAVLVNIEIMSPRDGFATSICSAS